MNKFKLTLDTENVETMVLGNIEPHWRLVTMRGTGEVRSVNVQEFDYIDYVSRFVTDLCFINEVDADDAADFINHMGVDHFI